MHDVFLKRMNEHCSNDTRQTEATTIDTVLACKSPYVSTTALLLFAADACPPKREVSSCPATRKLDCYDKLRDWGSYLEGLLVGGLFGLMITPQL